MVDVVTDFTLKIVDGNKFRVQTVHLWNKYNI